MKYAIVSDLHANESAFRAVIDDARSRGAGKFVCLGDVVGYGPLPAETLRLARETCDLVIAGNHDDAISGRGDASAFIDLAADAVQRHREALTSDDLAWLRSLPYTGTVDGAVLAHGDLYDPPKFYYIEDEKDASTSFTATESQLAFVGHTHVPGIFLVGGSGTVYKTSPQDFTLEAGKRYIVNPGSVGYPRVSNGSCYSSYVIYDSDEKTVTFNFLPFSVASVMQRGKTRRIKKRLIAMLLVLAAAAAAAAAWLLTPKVEISDDPALVVERRELALHPSDRSVRANLAVGKGSTPVQLNVTFTDGSGTLTGVENLTVKKSSMKGIRVPAGSVKAEFTARRNTADESPVIVLFAPDAESK